MGALNGPDGGERGQMKFLANLFGARHNADETAEALRLASERTADERRLARLAKSEVITKLFQGMLDTVNGNDDGQTSPDNRPDGGGPILGR